MQRQQGGGRTRAGVFLIGSLVMAVLAGGLVLRVLKKAEADRAEADKPSATIDVVIAERDLYMGLPIGADDVVVRQLAPEMVPAESTFRQLSDVLGRTPREHVLANEPLREERLARPDAGIGLNAIVTPGKRAMTVATDTEDAVAGLLQAGNYVDIIVTIKPDDTSVVGAKWATDTILQGVKVLAVGGQLSGQEEPTVDPKTRKKVDKRQPAQRMKPSITLEVTPEEAEKLALAVSQGAIHVVLRSDTDNLQIATHGLTTSKNLIGYPSQIAAPPPDPKKPVDAPPPPPLPQAEVISGSSKTKVEYKDGGGTNIIGTEKGPRKKPQ